MPSKSAAKKSEPKATKSAAVAAPAPAKKETKSKAKKEEVKKVAEPEVQNVEVKADSTETSITDNFAEFITKFQGMMSQFSSLKAELKVLERKTMKQLKVVQKLNNKKRKKGTRAPSGFVKPSLISDELFLIGSFEPGIKCFCLFVLSSMTKLMYLPILKRFMNIIEM